MAQAESPKRDFETPLRPPHTRSSSTDEDEKEPGAPKKERLLIDHKEANERKLMIKKIACRLFLHQNDVSPPETIIQKLRELPKTYCTTSFKKDDPIRDVAKIFQVEDMSPEQVASRICTLKAQARTNHDMYPLQSRAEGSQCFSTYLDSWLLLGGKEFNRNLGGTEKSTDIDKITSELLELIFEICTTKTRMKLREIYYTNTKLYQSPEMVRDVANDICCMIGCTRSSLGISAIEKGLFYGDMTFSVGKQDGSKQDYNGLSNDNGTTIPARLTNIRDIKSEALFILVVEKDTVFERLVLDGFCDKYKCIIITAKGMPDVITRGFLSLITRVLNLRVFAVMDCNPYGLKIYGIYRYGSKVMSYDRENLATPGIELLGIRFSHIGEYKIPQKSIEKMTKKDRATVRELLALECMKEYHDNLRSMRDHKRKIQIEAFHSHGITYFAKVALPRMLDQKLTQLHDAPVYIIGSDQIYGKELEIISSDDDEKKFYILCLDLYFVNWVCKSTY